MCVQIGFLEGILRVFGPCSTLLLAMLSYVNRNSAAMIYILITHSSNVLFETFNVASSEFHTRQVFRRAAQLPYIHL